jgi:hypothetical protein
MANLDGSKPYKTPMRKTRISPLKSNLSQSEKDFIAGLKAKEAIRKKTGSYPNTAQ